MIEEDYATAKYAKDIKYAVYYYADRFEKWHRILTFVNMLIMDRQEGPPFTELLSLLLSLHFTLFYFPCESRFPDIFCRAPKILHKKNRFSFEVLIYHNYTDHNFPFLRQPVGRMTSKPKNFPTTELYLSNPSSRSALPPTVR